MKNEKNKNNTLVIVESPAKAKTIQKYLPKGYSVKATMGHIIDLPKSRMGVNIEQDFEPEYIKIRGKGDLLKELKKEANKADNILLATDPDREGEAISWHVARFLDLDLNTDCRIEFHEITKKAVNNAIKNKRKVDMDLVDSQQARRVLDRIVGYSISPVLWKKVKRGLSAGRVQSVATKMIVDREREIQSFTPEEYWVLSAILHKKDENDLFEATLVSEKGEKVSIHNAEDANRIAQKVEKDQYFVEKVNKRVKNQKAPNPFTTSALQQAAYQKCGFSTQKTMRIAQQLYEGVSIKGKGQTGLITYIRTDSVRLADEAKAAAKDYIEKYLGSEYVGGNSKNVKKKNVQDAHEAIRPTDINLIPEMIKDSLDRDQYKLYNLIWQQMLASQMADAQYYITEADIINDDLLFKVSGEQLKFEGFTKILERKKQKDVLLPELNEGEKLALEKVNKEQKFTKPPSRYTEASLVKAMEQKGIGRPSTYAPTISTIKNRDYVTIKEKYFYPTDLGFKVTDLMTQFFKDIVDEAFTAKMENELDGIAEGDKMWKEILRTFYDPFSKALFDAQTNAEQVEIKEEVTDIECEYCGSKMVIKKGKYGKFIACPNYPECKNAKPLQEKTSGKCPECGSVLIKKTSKKGRTFFSCESYPKCEFATWDQPVADKCPRCGLTMFQKGFGSRKKIYCIQCNKE